MRAAVARRRGADRGPRRARPSPGERRGAAAAAAPWASAAPTSTSSTATATTTRTRAASASRFEVEPQVLGHEIVGTVVECGAGVADLRPGDDVVVDQGINCVSAGRAPRCEYCATGDSHQCAFYREHGITGLPGGLAEFVTVPAVNTIPIGDGRAARDHAALTEPLGCIVHSSDMVRARRRALRPRPRRSRAARAHRARLRRGARGAALHPVPAPGARVAGAHPGDRPQPGEACAGRALRSRADRARRGRGRDRRRAGADRRPARGVPRSTHRASAACSARSPASCASRRPCCSTGTGTPAST